MVRLKSVSVILVVLLMFAGMNFFLDFSHEPAKVSGAVLHVGSSGKYSTIQSAVDAATSGDTIIVQNGTYVENVTIYKTNIELIGNSTTDCTIQHKYMGTHPINDYAAVINVTASGVKITGFNISASGTYTMGIRVNTTAANGTTIINNNITTFGDAGIAIMLYQASKNTIKDNNINTSGMGATGIHFESSSDNTIDNNDVLTLGMSAHGFYLKQSSNVNTIMNNTVNTIWPASYAAYLDSSFNNTLHNNFLRTYELNSHVIWLFDSDYNNITLNTVKAVGSDGFSIYLQQSLSNNVMDNTINSTGFQKDGIQLSQSSDNNKLINNTINTTNIMADGIYIYDSDSNIVEDNKIRAGNTALHGIYLYQADDNEVINNTVFVAENMVFGIYIREGTSNNVTDNDINATGAMGFGINLESTTDNNIVKNTIVTNNSMAFGIQIDTSSNNDILDNTINTSGPSGIGIFAKSTSSYNKIIGNDIETYGTNGSGIYLQATSNTHEVVDNTINTNNIDGHGIVLITVYNYNITANTVYTKAVQAFGILLFQVTDSYFVGNTIKTNEFFGHGILAFVNSDGNTFINNNVTTLGNSGIGIFINNSDQNTVIGSTFTASGASTAGIFLFSQNATFINSTIISTALDIYVSNDANLTMINCSFKTVMATAGGGGVVQVKNYLEVQAYYEDGLTPIADADVNVTDNGVEIYASSGYGGSDSATGANGKTGLIVVSDRWFVYSNTATENVTGVSVKKTVDSTWEEVRANVDMNTSHTETFIASDIVAPSIPSGFVVNREGVSSTLNVSWNSNSDTINYSIYSNRTGSWVLIANITHPTLFYLDISLTLNVWYFYKIQAWDKANNSSPISTAISYFLKDLTPPPVPTGLSAAPVPGGDALNITWDLNTDTVMYSVWWQDPGTSIWTQIMNVTHPTNWFVWSHSSLVNGSTYSFKIRAWDSVDNPSGFTSQVNVVHRDYIAPAPPTNLQAVAASEYVIGLSWNPSPSSDVEGYEVYINQSGAGSGGPYKFVAIVLVNTYQCTGLVENTTYYFVVTAFDEANNPSVYSTEASDTTSAVAPGKPVLDVLPMYTNIPLIDITGTSDLNVMVFVYNNGGLAGSGATDASGNFDIQITLTEDSNDIKARARDNAMVHGVFSDAQAVILDTIKPTADAGADIEINESETADFDASGSSDKNGIVNYIWAFLYGSPPPVVLEGKTQSFKFDDPGIYTVTLTVFDPANNFNTDTLTVTVKEIIEVIPAPPRPAVVETDPPEASVDYPVDAALAVTFNITMNTSSVESVISISPLTDVTYSWDIAEKIVTITPDENLSFNTTYTVTIGSAKAVAGGLLLDSPFVLTFTTELEEKKPDIKPGQKPSINILSPVIGKTEFEPGETITVSGNSTDIDTGTDVTLSLNGTIATGSIGSDGLWSAQIAVPETEGEYVLNVTAGEQSREITITVKKPTIQPPPDGDGDGKGEDKEGDEANMMLYLALALIIVVVIIIAVVMMMRKKKPEKMEEEPSEGEEEEPLEGEEGEPDYEEQDLYKEDQAGPEQVEEQPVQEEVPEEEADIEAPSEEENANP